MTLDEQFPLTTTGTSFRPASALAEGEHVLKVRAVDKVGNVGEEVVVGVVTVDTTPPEVPGMPIPEEDPTSNRTPKWTWEPSADAAGDLQCYRVYLDGVFVCEVEPSEVPEFTADKYKSPLTHGMHVLQVTAVDDLGNESYPSPQGHVRIDIIAPEIPELYPMPEYSRLTDITFAWSPASDDLRVDYEFQYRLNDGAWQSVLTRSEFYTIPAGMLADGDRVYARVRSFDLVGNSRSDEVRS